MLLGMSFQDLPQGWLTQPIDTSQRAADVVDLSLTIEDREQGALLFLPLDGEGIALPPPFCVTGVLDADGTPAHAGVRLLPLLEAVVASDDVRAMVFARAREGRVLLTDRDREWHQVATELCREVGVALPFAFLAIPEIVRAFPEPLTLSGLAS